MLPSVAVPDTTKFGIVTVLDTFKSPTVAVPLHTRPLIVAVPDTTNVPSVANAPNVAVPDTLRLPTVALAMTVILPISATPPLAVIVTVAELPTAIVCVVVPSVIVDDKDISTFVENDAVVAEARSSLAALIPAEEFMLSLSMFPLTRVYKVVSLSVTSAG